MKRYLVLMLLVFLASGAMGGLKFKRQVNGTDAELEAPAASTSTQRPLVQCLRSCPSTSEHNPVCGTDMVIYNNPGKLICARFCGVNVQQLRVGACPDDTTSTNTTAPV